MRLPHFVVSAGVLALMACEAPAERQVVPDRVATARSIEGIAITMKQERDQHDQALAKLREDVFQHENTSAIERVDAELAEARASGQAARVRKLEKRRQELVDDVDQATAEQPWAEAATDDPRRSPSR